MPRRNTDLELVMVTMLRLIAQHNTAGWIVKKLAEFQEQEEYNLDCAANLRSILDEHRDVTYVNGEKSKPVQRRRIPPREPHSFWQEP